MNSKQKMKKIEETMDPFELFPKELWEIIGDEVEDSKDIVSLLQALPKLDIEFQNRKRYWLIGEILPFLYNLIDKEDIKSLRLTCKQWKMKVESYIFNQPLYRAYSHELDKNNHAFWDFLSGGKSNNVFRFSQQLCPIRMTTAECEKWIRTPNFKNPFKSRILTLHPFLNSHLPEQYLFPELVLQLLNGHGGHIWNLSICCFAFSCPIFDSQESRNLGITYVLKMIQKVPNLKSLKFCITRFEAPNNYIGKQEKKPLAIMESDLPELPFLETLEITLHRNDLITDEFASLLMKRYGAQIRRLSLPISRWKVEEFKEQFPQLTELHLTIFVDDFEYLLQLKTVLSTLCAPNLARITLNFWTWKSIQWELSSKDILNWLKRFPRIKYFEMVGDVKSTMGRVIVKEEGTSDPLKDEVTTLETLKIAASKRLSSNFLRCFPSLRNFELAIPIYPVYPTIGSNNLQIVG